MLDYRALMDGSRKDIAAAFCRAGLSVAACGYGLAVRLRNRRFDRPDYAAENAGVPVISVGNITAGGTGKTPLVAAIAKHLRNREVRVALVSRGYGSDQTGLNDEARELYDRLPDVPHLQNPDRVEACRVAVEELDMQAIILDDGFQHRRLKRDLDIVIIDATCPFGYGHLLPRGLLREPLKGLRRADLIVLSRSGLITEQARDALIDRIKTFAPDAPITCCDHVPTGLIGAESSEGNSLRPLKDLQDRPVVAFAGIGNPGPFFESLKKLGATVVASKSLPDHCRYDRQTVDKLTQWLESLRDSTPDIMAICTHKDLVKLRTVQLANVPVWALSIEVQLNAGAEEFWSAIDRVASVRATSEPAL